MLLKNIVCAAFAVVFLAGQAWADIFGAVSDGDVQAVKEYIAKGGDVNAKARYDGKTPLDSAAFYGNADVARLLISSGADVDAKNNDGKTPLITASFRGHVDVAKLLISSGADVNAKDASGYTPLHWAAFYGIADVARLLISSGADVTA